MDDKKVTLGNATEAALQNVYDVFSAAPKPDLIGGCPCCITESEACGLLAAPLRNLTSDQLCDYAASVLLTVGSEEDFRYFLPRLLELSIHDEFTWPDREVLFGKLHLAEWQDWPAIERQAIERLALAAFEDDLASGDIYQIDSWLCTAAHSHLPLQPFLTRLEQPDQVMACQGLFDWNADYLPSGRLRNAFWPENSRAMQEVVHWLTSIEEIIAKRSRPLN
ncbi:MAG TPA: hypothetical protein VN229_24205 [Terriglobales bacterium]|nr:hypothetical protein [Terriglobales bacterium]